jgi:methylmalonyl-CoA/ethylmalonyl-CoA epimerase
MTGPPAVDWAVSHHRPTNTEGFRLDHVAVAVPDLSAAVSSLLAHEGIALGASGESGTLRAAQVMFGPAGTTVEVLGSAADPGFVDRFLAQRGPGPHHLAFWTADIDEAIQRARAAGFDPIDIVRRGRLQHEFFLSPRQTGGVLIQVMSRSISDEEHMALVGPGGPRSGHALGWLRESPPASRAPVELRGIEVAQTFAAAARRLFSEALGGQLVVDTRGPMVFDWPGGRIRVVTGDNGIRALITSGPVDLPGVRVDD